MGQIKNKIIQDFYFITTVTGGRYPYFIEDIFCELFIEVLLFAKTIYHFDIFGYKINPDHIHLLVRPNGTDSISNIMASIKRNHTRYYNNLINCRIIPGDEKSALNKFGKKFYSHINNLRKLQSDYFDKYNNPIAKKFSWQKSFHHIIIKDKENFFIHLNYIQSQWKKHNLLENKYCFIDKNIF
jgi:REP element-mobilizing transposase RayT